MALLVHLYLQIQPPLSNFSKDYLVSRDSFAIEVTHWANIGQRLVMFSEHEDIQQA
jgi:hypothetical protein